MLADCTGILGAFHDLELGAAELPLLERGARLAGGHPGDGITGGRIAGRRVDLVIGCSEWSTYRILIAEARRLLEKEHVDVLVGPGGDSDGLVVREIARRHPGVAFVASLSRAQETTLSRSVPNLFRFQPDGAQEAAGLGSYAYHRLGWRTAAVVADDLSTGWPRVAGFVAEFCALGGRVVSRIWTPATVPLRGALAARVADVDGVAVLPGDAFLDWSGFVKAYKRIHPNVARHLVLGPEALILPSSRTAAARLAEGVVAGDSAPFESRNPVWLRLQRGFEQRFPGIPRLSSPAQFPLALAYYGAMKATLQALEAVRGDLSDHEGRFMAALAHAVVASPTGPIRLDGNRQAIAPSYLFQVGRDERGKPRIRTLRTIVNVEQTFNGYFTASTPPPTKTAPACRRASPPAWAR